MRPPGSPPDNPVIVDTVVLRYFLLAGQFDLLAEVLEDQIMVSRIVYDPVDEGRDVVHSEMDRSIQFQERRAANLELSADERERAWRFASRLAMIYDLHTSIRIAIADMSRQERELYAKLVSPDHSHEYGLAFPLGDGEAASIAIAVERECTLATDDNDALKALHSLRPDHPYLRIRRILINAADLGFIDPAEANRIHSEMRNCGFWDRKSPFPE